MPAHDHPPRRRPPRVRRPGTERLPLGARGAGRPRRRRRPGPRPTTPARCAIAGDRPAPATAARASRPRSPADAGAPATAADAAHPEQPAPGRAGRNLAAAIGVGLGLGAVIIASLLLWRPAFVGVVTGRGAGRRRRADPRARRRAVPRRRWCRCWSARVAMEGLAWTRGPDRPGRRLPAHRARRRPLAARRRAGRATCGRLGRRSSSPLYVPLLAGFAVLLLVARRRRGPGARVHRDRRLPATSAATRPACCSASTRWRRRSARRSPGRASPARCWPACSSATLLLALAFDGALVGRRCSSGGDGGPADVGDLGESLIKRDLGHQGHGRPAARPRRPHGPAGLAAALRRGRLPAARGPRAGLTFRPAAGPSHTEPTTSKPRRAYQCRGQSSATASRTTRSQPARAARSSARARTASACPRPRRRGIGEHRVHRGRRAVDAAADRRRPPGPASRTTRSVTATTRVVQLLPADQVLDHAHPGPGRSGSSRRHERCPELVHLRLGPRTSTRSPPGRRSGRTAHLHQLLRLPAPAAQLRGDVVGPRPQQARRPVRPAGVPADLVGHGLDGGGVHRVR